MIIDMLENLPQHDLWTVRSLIQIEDHHGMGSDLQKQAKVKWKNHIYISFLFKEKPHAKVISKGLGLIPI